MKNIKGLIACLCLAVVSQGAFAQGTKIGVLNALQALFNSEPAKIAQEEIRQEFIIDEERALELTTRLLSCKRNISKMKR